MFDFGDQGYHEYRATQGKGANNNKLGEGLSLVLLVVWIVLAIPFVGFIGSFLWHSWMGR